MFNNKNKSAHSLVLRARCEQKLLNGESRGVDLSNCKNFCVILLLGVLCFIVEPLKMMRCQRGELKNEKRARQMHACKHIHSSSSTYFCRARKNRVCNSSRYFSWWRAARRERASGIYVGTKERERDGWRQERILVDLLLRATNYQKEKESAHNKYSWVCMVWWMN